MSKAQKFKITLEPLILKLPKNYVAQLKLGYFKNAKEMLEHLIFCHGFAESLPLNKLEIHSVERAK